MRAVVVLQASIHVSKAVRFTRRASDREQTYLICHDHQATVPQRVGARVHLALLQSHNLLDRLDLGVLQQSLAARLADVEQLASEREDTVIVAADDRETRDGERLGRVSFGQDQRALVAVPGPGVVRVLELDETGNTAGRQKAGSVSATADMGRREKERTASACVRPSSSAPGPA